VKTPAKVLDRLRAGSSIAYRTRADAAAAWVARGRREDLDGWQAALGSAVRLALLLAAGYGAFRVCRAWPGLLWAVAGCWLLLAWRAGAPAAPEPADEEPLADDPADAIRALLWQLIGDAPGVHLRDVLAHLHEHGHHPSWTVADLRRHLERHGIPVDPKLKLSGTPTRGVRRDALGTPPPAVDRAPSPATSPAV
jgi:hypothetical protein